MRTEDELQMLERDIYAVEFWASAGNPPAIAEELAKLKAKRDHLRARLAAETREQLEIHRKAGM